MNPASGISKYPASPVAEDASNMEPGTLTTASCEQRDQNTSQSSQAENEPLKELPSSCGVCSKGPEETSEAPKVGENPADEDEILQNPESHENIQVAEATNYPSGNPAAAQNGQRHEKDTTPLAENQPGLGEESDLEGRMPGVTYTSDISRLQGPRRSDPPTARGRLRDPSRITITLHRNSLLMPPQRTLPDILIRRSATILIGPQIWNGERMLFYRRVSAQRCPFRPAEQAATASQQARQTSRRRPLNFTRAAPQAAPPLGTRGNSRRNNRRLNQPTSEFTSNTTNQTTRQ
ncbi:hypothetical protein TWF730_008119 [Orbilia blumenaviensis]|uniref:Uncharacterized protein n=1 Tax=Orbilia blumenaviensis TaxID=1796055 RepID=A0AAV9V9V3_9PEZI